MATKKRSYLHILFVGLSVVFFWRGAWGLMDLYLFPNNPLASYLTSFIIGLVVLIATEKFAEELL